MLHYQRVGLHVSREYVEYLLLYAIQIVVLSLQVGHLGSELSDVVSEICARLCALPLDEVQVVQLAALEVWVLELGVLALMAALVEPVEVELPYEGAEVLVAEVARQDE